MLLISWCNFFQLLRLKFVSKKVTWLFHHILNIVCTLCISDKVKLVHDNLPGPHFQVNYEKIDGIFPSLSLNTFFQVNCLIRFVALPYLTDVASRWRQCSIWTSTTVDLSSWSESVALSLVRSIPSLCPGTSSSVFLSLCCQLFCLSV